MQFSSSLIICKTWKVTCIIVSGIYFLQCCQSTATERELKELLDGLLNESVYDRQIKPSENMSEPTTVGIEIVLVKMLSVEESKMQLTATLFLRQVWRDHRLQYNESMVDSHVTLGYRRVPQVWSPDLNFINENDGWLHELVVPNMLLKLWPNGTIVFSQRMTVSFHCMMDLLRYPFDNQTCQIRIESYGYDETELKLKWNDNIQFAFADSSAGTTDFVLQGTSIATELTAYKETIGNYTSLVAYFRLKRYYSYFMLQTFVPCILVVAVSWASFWLHIQATPARASLGILTVLTMTSLASGFTAVLPRVPYVKAIDIWLCACLVIVVLAFVEFAIVQILYRMAQDGMTKLRATDVDRLWSLDSDVAGMTDNNIQLQAYRRRCTQDQSITNDNSLHVNAAFNSSRENVGHNNDVITTTPKVTADATTEMANRCKFERYHRYLRSANNIEVGSRIFFPVVFLLFNVWYWLTYAMDAGFST